MMKIIILHGDDENKLFARLQKFITVARSRGWEVSYLTDSSSLEEQLSEISLFGSQRFFILRDISKLGKKELEWIRKNNEKLEGNLIIYHEGYLPQAIIKSLPKESKIEEFKLPVLLWNFLDEFVPGNSTKLIKDFHKVVEREAPEFVITLISRLMRDLYWVKVDPKSVQLPPWRVQKLKNQSSHYSVGKLREIISLLSEIDIKVKSSKANLVSELDLFIIKQLE